MGDFLPCGDRERKGEEKRETKGPREVRDALAVPIRRAAGNHRKEGEKDFGPRIVFALM